MGKVFSEEYLFCIVEIRLYLYDDDFEFWVMYCCKVMEGICFVCEWVICYLLCEVRVSMV